MQLYYSFNLNNDKFPILPKKISKFYLKAKYLALFLDFLKIFFISVTIIFLDFIGIRCIFLLYGALLFKQAEHSVTFSKSEFY